VSADYRTEHYKGYNHLDANPPWIHVVLRYDGSAVGSFSREEITELVELAEQAWPGLAVGLALAAYKQAADDMLAAVHFHSATGQEDAPCLCKEPGTYARQAPNPLAPDFG
jgi:hypothetical protein